MSNPKSIQTLYRDLMEAHRQGYLNVQVTRFWKHEQISILFSPLVHEGKRAHVKAHIQKHYNVQIWWDGKDALVVQPLP